MINIDKLYNEWLYIKKKEVKLISYDKYESIGNLYVLPFLKTQPIESLNVSIVSDYINKHINNGLSSQSVQTIKMTFKSLYTYAEEKYALKHIDFSLIKIPSDKKVTTVDEYQEKIIYEYCCNHKDALSVAIILCLYAGISFTEICALKYSDIDLNNGRINIAKKVQRKINRNNELSKTVFAAEDLVPPEKRIIGLSPFIVSYLNDFMSQGKPDYDCYMLNKNNKIPEQRIYQRKIKELSNMLGFEVTFVMLRNTCKEKCIKNNVNVHTILNTLGLTKLVISADNERDIDITYNQEEMNKISPDFLFK
ncbi:MAG: site-specific integrase [Erysipelotrichaceae bacterium]|nr:site-specific integrase [Erysipelotrichaceae bacterium]